MKNSLLMLAGAAALTLASCSQEKTTEVTTVPADGAAVGATTTTTTTTISAPMTDAEIEARAQRIADKMVADMKITDAATKTKIRTVYVNRYKHLNELRTKYGTDSTGMAAAMRESNMSTDTEFKTVFTDPTQYQAYESSRTTYYADDNTPMDNVSPDVNTSSSDMSNSASPAVSGTTMAPDGGKMKVKADGDIKIKDAQGNKLKIDGDDGTLKEKPVDGGKTKIK